MKAVTKVNLDDDEHPGFTPDLVLIEWSKKIENDLLERAHIERVKAMGPDSTHDHSLLAEMAQDLKTMRDGRNEVMLELASSKAIIADQSKQLAANQTVILRQAEEIAALKAERDALKRDGKKMAKLVRNWLPPDSATSSPASPPAAKRQCTYPVPVQYPVPAKLDTQLIEESSAPSVPPPPFANVDSASADVFDEDATVALSSNFGTSSTVSLTYNNDAYVNAEITGNSAERFANVLEEMSKSRMISFSDNDTFSAKTLPMRFTTNKQLLKNCFELASFAGDKSDLAILAS
jgi:hypothetical protein